MCKWLTWGGCAVISLSHSLFKCNTYSPKAWFYMHNMRSCSLRAVSDHFVINILWCTSINLELSANGRQTLPGDCVTGSSVKSSIHCAAVIDSIFKSCFWGRHPTLLLCRKAKRRPFYRCPQSVIQSAEAFTKALKMIGSHGEGSAI